MKSHGKSNSGDGLDELVSSALHVEVDGRRLSRLESFWRFESIRRRRRRMLWQATALAASVAIAATAALPRRGREEAPPIDPQAGNLARNSDVDRDERVIDVGVDHVGGDAEEHVANDRKGAPDKALPPFVRRPTSLERTMFTLRSGVRVAAPPSPGTRELDAMIKLLAEHAEFSVEQVVVDATLSPRQAETLLLRRLRGRSPAEQIAVIRLLGFYGERRAAAKLVRLAVDERLGEAAAAALDQLLPPGELARLAAHSLDQRRLRRFAMRLLQSDSERRYRGFLALVANDATRRDALFAIETLANPPLDRLFALLEDEDQQMRVAAALTLGRLNGPEVTRRLIGLVTDESVDGREPWIALLACRGDMAEKFLSYAAFRPGLLGPLNSARAWWTRMSL